MPYSRTYGTTRFQIRSAAKLGLPSAWLDGELNDIYTILNGMSLIANSSEWSLQNSAVTYVDASNFTVSGDLTTTFRVNRRIRANLSGTYVFSKVSVVSYNGGSGLTTVTLASAVLTIALSQIHYGIIDSLFAESSVHAEIIASDATGDVAATNVQAAIAELASEKMRADQKAAASGVASLDGSSKVVQEPASATATKTNNAIVKADANGVVNFGVTQLASLRPMFLAYLQADATCSVGMNQAICDGESFDNNSNYAPVTGRFTPTVAGYYKIGGTVMIHGATNTTQIIAFIKRNGTTEFQGAVLNTSNSGAQEGASVEAIVYMNGSTDYVELWYQANGSGALTVDGGSVPFVTFFWGHII